MREPVLLETGSDTRPGYERSEVTETIERAQKVIRVRLREIEGEQAQLSRALESLGGQTKGGSRSRSRSAQAPQRRSRRQSGRAARGQRRDQFLAALKKAPDARLSEIAKTIGVAPGQAHALARRLTDDGLLRKTGRGRYELTG